MVWVFNQTELDGDWKRFSMNFSVAFFIILNSKRWEQRTIVPGSHVPTGVLHSLQETVFFPDNFLSLNTKSELSEYTLAVHES